MRNESAEGDKQRHPKYLLEKPEVSLLNFWISRYVAKVQNKRGEPYPPKSIHQLLAGLQQYMLDKNPSAPQFLDKQETCFREIHAKDNRPQIDRSLLSYERVSAEQHKAVSKVLMSNPAYGERAGFQQEKLQVTHRSSADNIGQLFGDLTNFTIKNLTNPTITINSDEQVENEFDEVDF